MFLCNIAMHVLDNFFPFVKNTTAYRLGRCSLYLLLGTKELHGQANHIDAKKIIYGTLNVTRTPLESLFIKASAYSYPGCSLSKCVRRQLFDMLSCPSCVTIYWTLGNFLKPLATIDLPKSHTVLGNFCVGAKIFNFSSEIIFGQLL